MRVEFAIRTGPLLNSLEGTAFVKILAALLVLSTTVVAQYGPIPPDDLTEQRENARNYSMTRFDARLSSLEKRARQLEASLISRVDDNREIVRKQMNAHAVNIRKATKKLIVENVNAKATRDKKLAVKQKEEGVDPKDFNTNDYTGLALLLLGILSSLKGGDRG